jgi:Ser/Thr protein kinase RdoA (MazF antagonist)
MKIPAQSSTSRQLQYFKKLVLATLNEYDLSVDSVSFFTQDTNTMFHVYTRTQEHLVMRIYAEGNATLADNRAEIFFLNSIINHTHLHVTEPVARSDGDFISIISTPQFSTPQRCVLFKWIPGRLMERHIDANNYFLLGKTMAELHRYSRTISIPRDIQPKKWNGVFYYPDEPIVIDRPEFKHLFPRDQLRLLKTSILHSTRELQRLFDRSEPPMLLHGDLHYGNTKIFRGECYLLDFEDIILGFPEQDIAITLYYGRNREDYPMLTSAFKMGYSEIQPWPITSERQLLLLWAARAAMFINYVAHAEHTPEEFLSGAFDRLAVLMDKLGIVFE